MKKSPSERMKNRALGKNRDKVKKNSCEEESPESTSEEWKLSEEEELQLKNKVE